MNNRSQTLVPDTEILSPWNFLGDSSDLYSNEVTFGGLLDTFRMRTGPQKGQAVVRTLELFTPTPRPLEREETPVTELMTDCACMKKSPQNCKSTGLRELLGRQTCGSAHGEGMETPSQIPRPTYLIWLFLYVSSNILYHKLVNISVSMSSVNHCSNY